MNKGKKYPDSLHRYKIHYGDDEFCTFYGNGSTNAATIFKQFYPHKEIRKVEIMDDSWK